MVPYILHLQRLKIEAIHLKDHRQAFYCLFVFKNVESYMKVYP